MSALFDRFAPTQARIYGASSTTLSASLMADVLGKHRDLSVVGFWKPCKGQDLARYQKWFDARREDLLLPQYLEAFDWARVYLQLGCRRLCESDTFHGRTSQDLMLSAAKASLTVLGSVVYGTTGTLIAAAVSLDIPFDREGPTVRIGVSIEWWGGTT